jgi:hypothetical protein
MTPTARTPKTTTHTASSESPSAAASRDQQLRSRLAELKLTPPPKPSRACSTRPPPKACR